MSSAAGIVEGWRSETAIHATALRVTRRGDEERGRGAARLDEYRWLTEGVRGLRLEGAARLEAQGVSLRLIRAYLGIEQDDGPDAVVARVVGLRPVRR